MPDNNENKKRSGWWIFLYISPLYFLLAYPLYKWHKKINSSDINLSKDEYGAFSSSEGEIKKSPHLNLPPPKLHDSAFSVHYKIVRKKDGKESVPRKNSDKKAGIKTQKQTSKPPPLSARDRKFKSLGSKKGYMISLVGKMMNNKKVMKALFNNSMVIKGFMNRETTKAVLSSPDALIDYIKNTPAADNFLNNSVVKKALDSPNLTGAIASSKLAGAIMDSPAMKGLTENPSKLEELLQENPQLSLLLANPNIKNAISLNPKAADLFGKMKH